MQGYSDNAKAIYRRLYLLPNESIEDCHWRVARALASSDEEAERFKQLLDKQVVRLNTPCMINAGTSNGECWHACFILGLEDSMDSIIEMWEIVARIYKGGGGCGIPIGNLRHKGAPISSGGHASGPLSYLHVVQAIADSVRSGGRSRRAANIATMPYQHPDIFDFINCKGQSGTTFQAFNLSVLVDDEFFQQRSEASQSSALQELWEAICTKAWACGDPGLLFHNTVNRYNYAPWLGEIRTTNPCGEVAGPPWTVCCLGHINLVKCLEGEAFSFEKLKAFTRDTVWMLNRILDRSPYPHKRFEEVAKSVRPIGVGLMGFADLLYILRIPYDSGKAVQLFSKICRSLTRYAFEASAEYAAIEGCVAHIPPEHAKHAQWLQRYYANRTFDQLANLTVTCIAPTGSTALSADCSYSFEPHFAIVWEKLLDDGSKMRFVNPHFLEACAKEGINITDQDIDQIIEHKGSIQELSKLPGHIRQVFECAHDIHWKDRLQMQAVGQRYITQSISSTVNLPNSATIEDVMEIYETAWKLGLKGITVFRDGCLDSQPVQFGKAGKAELCLKQERPQELEGRTYKLKTGNGTLYLTLNELNGKPFEVFVTIGKSGRDTAANAEAIGRLVSLCLRSGIPLEEVVRQLEGIGGESPIFQNGTLIKSVPDAIANILLKHCSASACRGEASAVGLCPQCGSPMRRDGSCRGGTCVACGYSKCC